VDTYGSIIAYYIDGTHDWLAMWNSTLLITNAMGAANMYLPPSGSINWSLGIQWNVTTPHVAVPNPQGFSLGCPYSDGNVVFACTALFTAPTDNLTLVAYSAKDGHKLWDNSFSDIFVPGASIYQFFGNPHNGVLPVSVKDLRQWYGYDEITGQRIWGPTEPLPNAWDTFTTIGAGYGNLYVGTMAGRIYCYNIKTGALNWTYVLPSSGYETPYGSYPLMGGNAVSFYKGITVADGKVYAITGEHTPDSPYWLGGAMYAVNATTGDLVYKMSGWWTATPPIADGYILDHNCYDGTIYSFGKGQTATTITAPDTAITQGQNVVIKGTVMDESPGAMDYAGNRLNTQGTPAIADEYMTEWMEYLYQQKPRPSNATGVEVTLDVLDSNGNYRNIGTATSDSNGFYSFTWQPDIPGDFTVYANFAGSESYWPSQAETAFTVMQAPAATPAPTPQPASLADVYLLPATIGIIIAIAVATIVIVLMLRKR
jgi:hypothetical protein